MAFCSPDLQNISLTLTSRVGQQPMRRETFAIFNVSLGQRDLELDRRRLPNNIAASHWPIRLIIMSGFLLISTI